ncbi:unnamed protein product [Soboliphyme baturini]|uniref:Peptidase_M13_N domain-containing protein n=1 Tax=Soboliphyme baturini TaxID=241478 RepID=A0A183II44_9BILA|nr:unnamed protein product [Soboliphyme baturini]
MEKEEHEEWAKEEEDNEKKWRERKQKWKSEKEQENESKVQEIVEEKYKNWKEDRLDGPGHCSMLPASSDTPVLSFFCRSNEHTQMEICTSSTCVKAAANLMLTIDSTKDPCSNFYEYACGGWNQHFTIPDDMSRYGTFADVRVKVRRQMKGECFSSTRRNMRYELYN